VSELPKTREGLLDDIEECKSMVSMNSGTEKYVITRIHDYHHRLNRLKDSTRRWMAKRGVLERKLKELGDE